MRDKYFSRTFELDASRADAETRTAPVVLSTETPVDRGDYQEILSHAPEAIDLSRAPLPVLEAHDQGAVNIGIVEELRAEDGALRGTLRLGNTARARELWQDVVDRIVTGVSVGYRVLAHQMSDDGSVMTATRWLPMELSLVPVPADPNSGLFRSENMTMENDVTQAVEAERKRISDIRLACRQGGLDDVRADGFIEDGTSADTVRAAVLEEIAKRDEQTAIRTAVGDSHGGHGADYFRKAAVDGLILRAGGSIDNPAPGSADFRNASLVDIMRQCCAESGINTRGMSAADLVTRQATTDFPLILAAGSEKMMGTAFRLAASQHQAWTQVKNVRDFKSNSVVRISDAPELAAHTEGGTVTLGNFTEEAESIAATTYAKRWMITREALINDDLSAFSEVPAAFGQSAARKEADLVYAVLTTNGNMRDSNALFDGTNHGNVGTSGALSLATLNGLRLLLRKQTSPGGGFLNLTPRFLIVPPELESSAEELVRSVTVADPTSGDAFATQTWVGNLQIIAEPRLSADSTTQFYLFAQPGVGADGVARAYLQGRTGPTVETEPGWSTLDLEYRCVFDVGAAALDWRAVTRNAGV